MRVYNIVFPALQGRVDTRFRQCGESLRGVSLRDLDSSS